MAFHKAVAGKLRAGGTAGRSGFGTTTGGRARRWAGTIPTAYWKVSGIAADATTLPDTSKAANGFNGTLAGTVDEAGSDATWNTTTTPPGSSQSLRLNGTDNVVTIPYNAKLKPTSVNKLSISMWMKTTDTEGYMLCSEGADGTTGWVYCAVGIPSAGADKPVAVYFFSGTNANWRAGWGDGSVVSNDDNWHHVVFVYDESAANSVVVYQDGAVTATNNDQTGGWSSSSNNNVILQIGARQNASKWYKFFLDEMAYILMLA